MLSLEMAGKTHEEKKWKQKGKNIKKRFNLLETFLNILCRSNRILMRNFVGRDKGF